MRIHIRGVVQGVGFRPAVYRTASALGLNGRVWNDGPDVIIDVEDSKVFLDELMKNLPPLATVDDVSVDDSSADYADFRIVPSMDGMGGVGIPADTAICGKCLDDMGNGRRKGYEFTSCTDCGARFTLISRLPYDRGNTSMREFEMCPECEKEFNDPSDRRFHHQTICCPSCGPSYRLIGRDGTIPSDDPVRDFARMLDDGAIGVAKSWGGMHICASPRNVRELRKWYGRPNKPFAVMVRDADSMYRYGEPCDDELEQLTSVHRPIVLVPKVRSDITEMISPGLDNIGLFLPYTGMQHSLLRHMNGGALIMTSANLPGEPMLLNDDDVMELDADAYLLHDQPIINRADDSVVRVNSGNVSFIRRSRGHVPSYIEVPFGGCALGLGAQENLTASVISNGRIHSTQHIGDGDSLGVLEYLGSSVTSLTSMLGCSPDMIAMDLHPAYSNRSVGKRLAETFGCDTMDVQHHWAHTASLMIDNNVNECVALTLDGTGYGDDRNAWGGEVIRCDFRSYRRIAHLQYIPLLGSEKALYDLRRLKFAVDMMNGTENHDFTDDESAVLDKMMKKSVMTSSFGRLLDTIAYTLDVCANRTYDGEPAMRLEPLLSRGQEIEGFECDVVGGVMMTADLFTRMRAGMGKADIAYSIVRNVIRRMVESAADASDGFIGITGGVSYNGAICLMFTEECERLGRDALFHHNVPNGDGGISVGQAAIAARRIA